ncbi:hypothetical protein C8R44DRAFT_888474 [Mycena epipterygia]|nr:hypothetical protein C8R44DRAFT_888474 [Mycena epipterygia]
MAPQTHLLAILVSALIVSAQYHVESISGAFTNLGAGYEMGPKLKLGSANLISYGMLECTPEHTVKISADKTTHRANGHVAVIFYVGSEERYNTISCPHSGEMVGIVGVGDVDATLQTFAQFNVSESICLRFVIKPVVELEAPYLYLVGVEVTICCARDPKACLQYDKARGTLAIGPIQNTTISPYQLWTFQAIPRFVKDTEVEDAQKEDDATEATEAELSNADLKDIVKLPPPTENSVDAPSTGDSGGHPDTTSSGTASAGDSSGPTDSTSSDTTETGDSAGPPDQASDDTTSGGDSSAPEATNSDEMTPGDSTGGADTAASG